MSYKPRHPAIEGKYLQSWYARSVYACIRQSKSQEASHPFDHSRFSAQCFVQTRIAITSRFEARTVYANPALPSLPHPLYHSLSLYRSWLFVDPSIKQLRGVTIFQQLCKPLLSAKIYTATVIYSFLTPDVLTPVTSARYVSHPRDV